MAQRTLTAMFDTYAAAASAVARLEEAGISHDDISIVSNDPEHRAHLSEKVDESTGTAAGASLGTVLGGGAGLLAGLGMLAIPGLGPVVAAGWLAATLVGAGVGAAAGGVVGALTDAGVGHEDAHAYAEGINRGGTLITVRTDESNAGRVEAILDVDGTVDMNSRETEWRNTGWSGTAVGQDTMTGVPIVDPSVDSSTPVGTAVRGDTRGRVRVYGDGI